MIYIGYYDLYSSKIKRSYATSAVNKIRYMLKSFGKAYDRVDVFSCSVNLEPNFKIYASEVVTSENVHIHYPLSWGGKGKLHRFLLCLWIKICLFLYLILHARKGEHVYVYHSTGYGKSILWAKRIKKFKLILEVEEIYSDVQKDNRKIKNNEYLHFKSADAYIFSTNLLNESLNSQHKPYIVINGTYEVESKISDKFSDGKIHVVYAGTFDMRKGSVLATIATAKFLNNNYMIHICGFGTKDDEQNVIRLIAQSNNSAECKIQFHGLLKGNDYISFLQKCHIGLSTQDPTADFNATSFPSKILSYLSNGLSVVSVRIAAVEQSEVGSYVTYYDEQIPEKIADAIVQATIDNDSRQLISNLSKQFDENVKCIKLQLN